MAEFPIEPKRKAANVSAGEVTLTLVAFTSDQPTEAVSVSYVDYRQGVGEGDRQAVLNGAAAGAASALEGTLESSSPTRYLGFDALDFVIDSDDGVISARGVLVDSRLYILQVVRTDQSEESESYDHLLDTFKLLPGPASPSPGATPSPGPESPSPAATLSPGATSSPDPVEPAGQ